MKRKSEGNTHYGNAHTIPPYPSVEKTESFDFPFNLNAIISDVLLNVLTSRLKVLEETDEFKGSRKYF
ncbi:hypothetical protein FKX85_20140 [Echinicola soli]|uniref:Uncharacterized protein n=1 Tax=Echinicola soli TaxID=2591634 RepID=A0A514CN22_9BACT|nr:hypothetical protein [Echinicola soli]QDH81215.1 hypothetical protein FKX85_20140 [Echinicola soli]